MKSKKKNFEIRSLSTSNFINGKWESTATTFTSINPATEEILCSVSKATSDLVIKAVKSARYAQLEWNNVKLNDRQKILHKFVTLLKEHSEELSILITQEVGKPIFESRGEIYESIQHAKWFIETSSEVFEPNTLSNHEIKYEAIEYQGPIGIVGIIGVWNYPLGKSIWSIIPALLAGNAVIFKPSEYSPIVGILLAKLFEMCKLPPGVFNLLLGNAEVGREICNSDIDMISFTGSYETAQSIVNISSQRPKKLILELDGSDPFIVFEDADIDLAARGAVWGRFHNCGQVCVSAKRWIIHDTIFKSFIEKVVHILESLNIGNGLKENVDIGPLINKRQKQKMERFLQGALNEGAEILYKKKLPENLNKGFYVAPILISVTNLNMDIINQEVFGPIAPIIKFCNDDDAIKIANQSSYGLGASIWTKDSEKAKRIAKFIQAGMVWINDVALPIAGCSWGGMKKSGFGCELSQRGMLEFTQPKSIIENIAITKQREWWFPYHDINI